MTIDPLALDLGGTMKQVLTVQDASGLTQLELPEGLTRQESDNARSSPSEDAVSRFQSAMGEPQPNTLLGLVNRPVAAGGPESLDSPDGRGIPSSLRPLTPSTPSASPLTGGVSDTTGVRVPDTTGVQVPDTTGLRVPDTTGLRVSDTTGLQVPDTTGLQVPDTTGLQVPDTTGHQVPDTTGVQVPDTTGLQVPDTTGHRVSDTKSAGVKTLNRQSVRTQSATEKPEPDQVQAAAIPATFQPSNLLTPSTSGPNAVDGVVEVEIDPASASARTQELVDAAAVVADTILVTPSLVHGEGEVTIRLRPTVLGGSEIRLEAKGEAITVALTPATVEVQRLAEQSQARFAAELSERIPSFQIAVVINPRPNVSRRDLRDETA